MSHRYPSLIAAHFWCAFIGIIIYVVSLSIGGILQGLDMLDASKPFIDSVTVTIPYLEARSVGGALLVLGHVFLIANFLCVIFGVGPNRDKPAMFPLMRLVKAGGAS